MKTIRYFFTRENAFVIVSVLVIAAVATYGIMQSRTMINPAAYTPLLEVIAASESRGNYNAYFGNASNQDIDFTNKSVADVLGWQQTYVEQGSPSNAVGRYQIIQPTLQGLVDELQLDTSLPYNEKLQDALAISLMERRGSIDFVNGDISAEAFAHNLSKEWAALPRVTGDTPEDSFYAGDGLNRALVDSATILKAIEQFKLLAQE